MGHFAAEITARPDLGGYAPAGRRPEAQSTRVEQIEASDSPARRMAHDFNNLLGIITLNLELARERAGDEIREMIDEALDAAWRGSELTGRLTDFARSRSGWAEQIENRGPAVAAQAGPGSL